MDQIRERLENPVIAGIFGLIIGLVIGWFVIGWGIWPVQWTNGAPSDLAPIWQEDYLRAAIDSFSQTGDTEAAIRRWQDLGSNAQETLANVVANPGALEQSAIESFQNSVVSVPVEEAPGEEGTPALLWVACLVTLVLGVALLAMYLLRRTESTEMTPAMQAVEASRQAEQTDYTAIGEEPPLSQYMTTYMLGDDLFDDSFSIDSQGGEFLGECGVGIAETIGVGDPKRVTSFEVWLFDKNDIQTVTKVLMSDHVFNDPSNKERLAAKGEPIMAEIDKPIVLETETLQLVARVVDMSYGGAALPDNSFFERVTLELAVWQK
jgi:hypothetical protein